MNETNANRLSNGSRTMKAALMLQKPHLVNQGTIAYQNLGPLPDDAVYQRGSQRVAVRLIRDPQGIPVFPAKWLLIHEGGNTMMTASIYRAWIDQAIIAGTDQVIEVPWCRREILIRMKPQDDQSPIRSSFGAYAQTRLDHLPPLSIYEESLI